MKKASGILVVFIILTSLACSVTNLIAAPTPTPTLTYTPTLTPKPTLTPTPTITPTPMPTSTPAGETVDDPGGGYSIYIPSGYSSYIKDGVCLVTDNASPKLFRGMIFYHMLNKNADDFKSDWALNTLITATVDKFAPLGILADDKSDTYEVTIGEFKGRAIDFTGTEKTSSTSSGKLPIKGQVVAFVPDSTHVFWTVTWVDTSLDGPDAWTNQGKDIFYFILNSINFTQ